ncbi:MAG: sensor histidine kinase [Oscillospiraceae bacterium]
MKKALAKPSVLAVLLVVLYLLGLLLGACAISAFPIYRQKEFFFSRARDIARDELDNVETTLRKTVDANTRILIYDAAGNCLRHVTPTNSNSNDKPGVALQKYVSSVLSGNEIFRLALARETQRASSGFLSDIMVVVGIPIEKQGTVIGAVFLIKNLMDLPATIVGYTVYFTFFYWLSVFFIVSNTRKKRKLDQLQQNYIANVTHAFKTPIASIKALAETLCDGVEPDPDKQRVYYGMILQEANRQDHMVRDVLELSKLQSDGMDFTKTKVCAAAVFGPVWEKYATLCDCMGISLHISEEFSRLPPLYTNASCVKQILEILLDNAVKFVPEGGDIWVEASPGRSQTILCVRDNGVGISKEALPHVFERFFKGSHDFNASGSGLGLAIAKEIAAGLKEKIWAESEPGKGAAFFFTVHHK